jgi:hypothetical protein
MLTRGAVEIIDHKRVCGLLRYDEYRGDALGRPSSTAPTSPAKSSLCVIHDRVWRACLTWDI